MCDFQLLVCLPVCQLKSCVRARACVRRKRINRLYLYITSILTNKSEEMLTILNASSRSLLTQKMTLGETKQGTVVGYV
jgi:hypothetical protein